MSADLVAFLRDRLTEDERVAKEALPFDQWTPKGYRATRTSSGQGVTVPIVEVRADRLLAEVQAKRALLEAAENWHMDYEVRDRIFGSLALPYQDHPDYQQEWRP